jgi:hypothetical protein
MVLPCDAKDLKLLAACTKISIGNGQIASFGEINGWMGWPVAKRKKKHDTGGSFMQWQMAPVCI